MEIVLATNGLVGIGGSETYLLTVAEQLQRLGHEVTVHADEGGAMSEYMRSRGRRVAIGEAGAPRDLRRPAGPGRGDGLRARRPLAGDAAGVPRPVRLPRLPVPAAAAGRRRGGRRVQ